MPPSENEFPVKLPDGSDSTGIQVGVNHSVEQWNEYHLDDGSKLRLKTVLHEVARIKGAYDQEGNPVYVIKSSNVVSVHSASELKRKKT